MTHRRLARLLVLVGTVAVVLGLSKLHASSVATVPYDFTDSTRFASAIGFVVTLCVAAYAFGLPDLPRDLGRAELSTLGATGTAAVAVSLAQLVVGDALLPRFVVFGSALLLSVWYLVCVGISARGRIVAEERDRVVIVAAPHAAAQLADELAASPERNAQIAGVLSPADARPDGAGRRPLTDLVAVAGASVVVLDREAQDDESVVVQAAEAHALGVRVRTLSLFYEHWLGKLPVGELEQVSLLFDIGELHRARFGRFKRLGDLVVSVPGLVALALAVPFVAIGNLIANRGPLFYSQPRVGRNGREFTILKFRTMRAATERSTEWTAQDDPRVTPFGRLLRVSHVDELPQLLNVLRGDLSLVGPRPEQPRYVARLGEKLPFYNVRHLVRPGLTGWAQVNYPYGADERDALEKLQYEFFYLRNQSIALDLRILGRTIRSVLRREGR